MMAGMECDWCLCRDSGWILKKTSLIKEVVAPLEQDASLFHCALLGTALKGCEKEIPFVSQGAFPPYDSVYLHAVTKRAVVTDPYVIPLSSWLNEGELPTSSPFPGRMLSIGAEPRYKIFGLRKGYLFPGSFVEAGPTNSKASREGRSQGWECRTWLRIYSMFQRDC